MHRDHLDQADASARPGLSRLGWNAGREQQLSELGEDLEPARIVRVDRGQNLAQTETEVVRCTQGLRNVTATVGDWVALETMPDADFLRIAEVLPRTSVLERSGGVAVSSQAIAANIDYVFIIHPCDQVNLRRLERELAQVTASGASPVIVLAKSDIVFDLPEVMDEAKRVGRSVPVLTVSAVLGEGLEELAGIFNHGTTGAMIGPSGAGKSTLANALLGEELMSTGEVREDDRRGRHTTTARHLLQLPNGGALVDTPGMREFGLTGDTASIDVVFDDISERAANCRFRDCQHAGEPGCAVSEAIGSGEIDEDRLASYKKLEREQEAWRARNDPLLRKQREQVWKRRTRGMRQRMKLDRRWD